MRRYLDYDKNDETMVNLFYTITINGKMYEFEQSKIRKNHE